MAEKYTYAVARIRAKENALLGYQEIQQLLACRTYQEAVTLLVDKGYGDGEIFDTISLLLEYERAKSWKLVRELIPDPSEFELFLYEADFQNLKAAVKSILTSTSYDGLFLEYGSIAPSVILEAVRDREYSKLPAHLCKIAPEAMEVLLKTGNGQECDILIDRAALSAVWKAGKRAEAPMIQEYAELTVALADIKIAVRAVRTDKNINFLKRALAECDTLSLSALAAAASKGLDELFAYLQHTAYAEAVPHLQKSMSAFEKWCDNKVMGLIRSQKTNSFTIAPIIAYLLAKESEIKTVRIILSGKLNGFADELIEERVRELYV